ncbi:hypothetical protein PUN28_001744 [Cardiocondyla obscurior]|uniref:Uncharacterized protein n=1 Tax=Cardiocondyla obscurior TaxID=286306 RepID=A0AAW2GR06_9HYME
MIESTGSCGKARECCLAPRTMLTKASFLFFRDVVVVATTSLRDSPSRIRVREKSVNDVWAVVPSSKTLPSQSSNVSVVLVRVVDVVEDTTCSSSSCLLPDTSWSELLSTITTPCLSLETLLDVSRSFQGRNKPMLFDLDIPESTSVKHLFSLSRKTASYTNRTANATVRTVQR